MFFVKSIFIIYHAPRNLILLLQGSKFLTSSFSYCVLKNKQVFVFKTFQEKCKKMIFEIKFLLKIYRNENFCVKATAFDLKIQCECCRPQIFQIMNFVGSNNLSLIYQKCTPSGYRDIEISTYLSFLQRLNSFEFDYSIPAEYRNSINPKQAGGGRLATPSLQYFCPVTLIFDTITVKFCDF